MKKSAVFIMILMTAIFALVLTNGYAQEDMKEIDNSAFTNPVRTPAVFNHEDHNEAAEIEECGECHHVYEDGKLVEDETSEDQPCADCHELKTDDNRPHLMKAYHLNCKGCHTESKKGPVMCGECHKK